MSPQGDPEINEYQLLTILEIKKSNRHWHIIVSLSQIYPVHSLKSMATCSLSVCYCYSKHEDVTCAIEIMNSCLHKFILQPSSNEHNLINTIMILFRNDMYKLHTWLPVHVILMIESFFKEFKFFGKLILFLWFVISLCEFWPFRQKCVWNMQVIVSIRVEHMWNQKKNLARISFIN